jgi:ATP-dependent Clp protease protease subunit
MSTKIKNIYATNAELINKFLSQQECFDDVESIVNASSTLNRELYVGGISDEMSGGLEAIIRFWNRLDEQEGIPVAERKPIKLYIDSWGGELVSCYTIVNAIELSKTPVWTINIGAAYSAGFFIFIAGHKRIAYPLSSFLYHEGATTIMGDAHKFRNHADFYKKQLDQLKAHTLKYTKLSEEDYEKILKDDYWLTAEEALEKGVCDVIATRDFIVEGVI